VHLVHTKEQGCAENMPAVTLNGVSELDLSW